jgi:hypothetical protein
MRTRGARCRFRDRARGHAHAQVPPAAGQIKWLSEAASGCVGDIQPFARTVDIPPIIGVQWGMWVTNIEERH